MAQNGYSTDLTDEQWALIAPHLPPPRPGGRPRQTNLRDVVDAILYLLRTGCQWRLLPRNFPPWGTVWSYFRRWRIDGVWVRLHRALYRAARKKAGRSPDPTVAIMDSQSVKTTEKGVFAVLTVTRWSRGENGSYLLIPKAFLSLAVSSPQACRIAGEPAF
jgi:transposase